MIKRALFAAAMLLFVAVGFTSPANAGPKADCFTISPFLGGYWWEGGDGIEEHSFNIGAGLGYMVSDKLGLEGTFQYIPAHSERGGVDISGLIYKFDGLYHLPLNKTVVPYVAAGLGGITVDVSNGGSDSRFLFDYGAGVKYFLTDDLALRVDARHIIAFNKTSNALSYTFGIVYQFGGPKAAPPAPAPAPEVKPVEAPPPPPAPEVKPAPPAPPLDSDGDGVPDSIDKCPDTPKGVTVDADGCPLDSDGDGVPDYLDKCPGTPKGVAVDKDGCPLPLKKELVRNIKIEFDFDKSDVRPQYHEELKDVSEFLKAYPDNMAVIEGHTDSKGKDAYNLKLSQRRADAVRKYLVDKFGADPDKLSAKGYGESKPIAPNTTDEGRQRNRRVELHIKPLK